MSTHLGLFYAERFGNRIHVNIFEQVLSTLFLSDTNNNQADQFEPQMSL